MKTFKVRLFILISILSFFSGSAFSCKLSNSSVDSIKEKLQVIEKYSEEMVEDFREYRQASSQWKKNDTVRFHQSNQSIIAIQTDHIEDSLKRAGCL